MNRGGRQGTAVVQRRYKGEEAARFMESPLVTNDMHTGHEPGWGPLSLPSPRVAGRGWSKTGRGERFMESPLVTNDLHTGHEPRGRR